MLEIEVSDSAAVNGARGANLFDPFAGPAIEATAPSTESQREIWTAAHLGSSASLAYNESVSLELHGPVDVIALAAALQAAVARHDALRTTISADGTTLTVAPPGPCPLPLHDWSMLAPDEARERLRQLTEAEISAPFDLERGPLLRAHLARLSPELHIAIATAHHIVCDGWSTAVLLSDWAALYSARSSGPALPPADSFAAWAREEAGPARRARASADAAWWAAQLRDPPALELPADRPRPPSRTFASRRLDVRLDASLVASLRKAGARTGASLFHTLLAGFQCLLHRLAGQDDVVVGVPVAGQAESGRSALVGHCVQMLPLRSRAAATLPFDAVLAATRREMLDALEHQSLTFGGLLRTLPLRREASRLPIVSAVFNLDRAMSEEALRFDGCAAVLTTNPRCSEAFELFLNAVDLGGAVALECQYNAGLFDEATIRRWLSAYETLLRCAAADSSTQLGRLPLLGTAETAQLAAFSKGPVTDRGSEHCIHNLFEAQAGRTPEAIAVEAGFSQITYAVLAARAESVAVRLRAAGVRRGVVVGLCVERGVDLLAGLLGILKAGGAYLPLDPGHPRARLDFMLADAAAPVLLTQRALRAELPLEAARVICLDDAEDLAPRSSAAPEPPRGEDAEPDAQSPAYVLYTSGSTGKPKGVVVPHSAAVNLLRAVSRSPGMSAADVVLAITTLSFDIALSELVLPLTCGARVVLATREEAADGRALRALIESRAVTFIDATPTTWRLLLAAGWRGSANVTAICTGEPLPLDLAQELSPRVGALWNGYGPTEATVWATFWRVPASTQRVLVGRPLDNTTAYVLDAALQPQPVGVPGELYLGGAGIALGYLGRPELTAQRFLPDPFSPGGRFYRTGDLARFLPDGQLECLGRNDTQVKLRGYRIELGEIEEALSRQPGVLQAAVVLREDRPGDKRLAGYFVPAQSNVEAALPESQLRAGLALSLPEYMVPAHLIALAAMPLTPSGKIDRAALPAPDLDSRPVESFTAPRTPTEQLVATLWQEALSVGRMGVEDDFFALGGHSLLAAQVLARLRAEHGVELSFRTIFESPTIEKFAAAIARKSLNSSAAEAGPGRARVERRPQPGPAPLSLMQERIWLLDELEPAQRRVHQLPAAWRLTGALEVPLLERALAVIVARHESLRTSIELIDGTPAQVVAPRAELLLERVDLSALPAADREQALAELVRVETSRLSDLSRAPLLRTVLVRVAEAEQVLFVLPHNLVWDGWSFDLFLRELTAAYEALLRGESPTLPPLPVSYADFAVWQRARTSSPELQRQAAFWRAQLDGAPRDLALPSDRPRPAARTFGGSNVDLLVGPAEAAALLALGREAGGSLFTVLVAAFNVLLHRYTGATDLVVGTPVRGRPLPELENLIGLFINAVPLRTRIDPRRPFTGLLQEVREVTLDAFSNQDLPLEALGDRVPLLRAFFSLQDARARPQRMGPLALRQEGAPHHAAGNDLMLWTMEVAGGLRCVLNYSTDLFDEATAKRMLRQFRALLTAVIESPHTQVGELPLELPDELQRLAASPPAHKDTGAGGDLRQLLRVAASSSSEESALIEQSGVLGFAPQQLSALAASARALALGVGFWPGSALVSGSPAGSEAALLELVLALSTGARLVRCGAGAESLVRAIAARSVSPVETHDLLALAPAAVWQSAIDRGWAGSTSLCALVLGEPARGELASALRVRTSCAWNLLSDSQFGGWVGLGKLDDGGGARAVVRPLWPRGLNVLDEREQPAPEGIEGALVTCAQGPAAGYQPAFQRARRLDGGFFELISDERGHAWLGARHLDLAALEAEIAKDPALTGAAVAVHRDGATEQLVAWITPDPDATWTETELRARLRNQLGDELLPARFVELTAIPQHDAGGPDRTALLATLSLSRAPAELILPRTEAERLVAGLFSEALGVERVSVRDNFFDLGGHSLLCLQITAAIEDRTGHRLSPRVLLLDSVEQIAAQLGNLKTPQVPGVPAADGLSQRVFRRLRGLLR